jgi:hypothetical protein
LAQVRLHLPRLTVLQASPVRLELFLRVQPRVLALYLRVLPALPLQELLRRPLILRSLPSLV